MEVTLKADPFPHVLLGDFYSPEECDAVWQELRFLSTLVLPPDQTGSATFMDEKGVKHYKKNNLGVFLPDVYKEVAVSPIVRSNRKMFDKKLMERLKGFNFIFGYLPETNWDSVLIQFYLNGQSYKAHRDSAVFSAVINFHGESKEYGGGLLRFVDYDYAVDLKRNECILFPSFVEHEVTPVTLGTDDLMRSRITITTFIGVKPN